MGNTSCPLSASTALQSDARKNYHHLRLQRTSSRELMRAGLLCAVVVVVGVRSFHGRAMECWTPYEFTPNQNDYVEEVCWATSTYFIRPIDARLPPPDVRDSPARRLAWYQWLVRSLTLCSVNYRHLPGLFCSRDEEHSA